MPTWTELELTFLNSDKFIWYDNFVLFGEVPRYVIPDEIRGLDVSNSLYLEETLATKGMMIAEEKASAQSTCFRIIYMLLHINPPISTDGDFEYNGGLVYSFASDLIFQKLAKNDACRSCWYVQYWS
jgi:hypothetical protein